MGLRQAIAIRFLFLAAFLNACATEADAGDSAQYCITRQTPLFRLSFFDTNATTADPLAADGFCPVILQGRAVFRVDSGNLYITASPGSRILYSHAINPIHAGRVRIVWGVRHFPWGINWDNGATKREPLGIGLSFGDKMAMSCTDATSIVSIFMRALNWLQRLIDPPQTVVIFLGHAQWHNRMLEGNLFRKKIKYLSQNFQQTDSAGCIFSEFTIDSLYQQAFGWIPRQAPCVNVLSIEVDLDGLEDSSCAFVKTVELLP